MHQTLATSSKLDHGVYQGRPLRRRLERQKPWCQSLHQGLGSARDLTIDGLYHTPQFQATVDKARAATTPHTRQFLQQSNCYQSDTAKQRVYLTHDAYDAEDCSDKQCRPSPESSFLQWITQPCPTEAEISIIHSIACTRRFECTLNCQKAMELRLQGPT